MEDSAGGLRGLTWLCGVVISYSQKKDGERLCMVYIYASWLLVLVPNEISSATFDNSQNSIGELRANRCLCPYNLGYTRTLGYIYPTIVRIIAHPQADSVQECTFLPCISVRSHMLCPAKQSIQFLNSNSISNCHGHISIPAPSNSCNS